MSSILKNKYFIGMGTLIALAGVGIFNRTIEVTKEKLRVEGLPEEFEGKKIALIADLHQKTFGDDYVNLTSLTEAQQPDFIFFAGDLYSRSEEKPERKIGFLKKLMEIAPVYYAAGNHEIEHPEQFDRFCDKARAAGVHVLRNSMDHMVSEGRLLRVYGLELPLKYYRGRDGDHKDIPSLSAERVRRYLGDAPEDQCVFLIAHDPFFFKAYAEWGAAAVFSGHVHGGVIRLPFIGGLLSPERKFFPKYSKGIYTHERSVMALTAGLGKFRFNNPSEIMLLTLTGKKERKKPAGRPWSIR
ncbi:MAG: metallophosphoesterase [Ruminococcus sp.]|nr:metallophosphoesterase [Ruminococcus sp.]